MGTGGVYVRKISMLSSDETARLQMGNTLPPHKYDVYVEYAPFETFDATGEFFARDLYMPLTLAYAVTMESIQGATFSPPCLLVVRMNEAWSREHVYMVLSRLKVTRMDQFSNFVFIGHMRRGLHVQQCVLDFREKMFSL
jgi:hypothetical protein